VPDAINGAMDSTGRVVDSIKVTGSGDDRRIIISSRTAGD